MPTLQQLYSPLTREDVEAKFIEIAQALGFVVTAWDNLGAARGILSIVAQQIANETQTTALESRSSLLDYAANTDGTINPWLTLMAKSLFDVERVTASFATFNVTLTNTSGVTYPIDPGDLHLANSVTGKTYSNTTGGSLAGPGTLSVQVKADEVGSASNALTGQVTVMVTPLAGVTVTNPLPGIGSDDMTDAALVALCKAKFGSLSPDGPGASYAYFAQTAKHNDGTVVDVNRVSVSPYSASGQVIVHVASSSGIVPGTGTPSPDLSTDLGLVAQNILLNSTPSAVTVQVYSAVVHDVEIVATVYLRPTNTLDAPTAQAIVLARLVAYFETVPIGGTNLGAGGKIFLNAIVGEIYQSIPSQIADVAITSPLVDVSMAPADVAVLTSVLSDITVVFL